MSAEAAAKILTTIAERQQEQYRDILRDGTPEELGLLIASGDTDVVEALRMGSNSLRGTKPQRRWFR